MAGSLNKVMIIGNLGRDPEIRSTQDGREIANLAIATSESWNDKNTGERREKTEWHRVAIFSPGLVKVVKQYVKKGSKVFIEGALQTRKWTDNAGVEKYTTEIVLQAYSGTLTMLDGRRDGASSGGSDYGSSTNTSSFGGGSSSFGATSSAGSFGATSSGSDDFDDDIPF